MSPNLSVGAIRPRAPKAPPQRPHMAPRALGRAREPTRAAHTLCKDLQTSSELMLLLEKTSLFLTPKLLETFASQSLQRKNTSLHPKVFHRVTKRCTCKTNHKLHSSCSRRLELCRRCERHTEQTTVQTTSACTEPHPARGSLRPSGSVSEVGLRRARGETERTLWESLSRSPGNHTSLRHLKAKDATRHPTQPAKMTQQVLFHAGPHSNHFRPRGPKALP